MHYNAGRPSHSHVNRTHNDVQALESYTVHKTVPFNPVDKRTSAQVTMPDGTTITTSKGAPQVLSMIKCMNHAN